MNTPTPTPTPTPAQRRRTYERLASWQSAPLVPVFIRFEWCPHCYVPVAIMERELNDCYFCGYVFPSIRVSAGHG